MVFQMDTPMIYPLFSTDNGIPYVGYLDYKHYGETVMKFIGNNWIPVGQKGFTSDGAFGGSLAFSPIDGQLYVAYGANACFDNATVMKFNGTKWVYVGQRCFSSEDAHYTSLAFSPLDGQPYVVFQDVGYSNKATVMKYDSVMVGINEQQESRLSLYPNPASAIITIETTDIPTRSLLSISDINGQQLITRQLTQPKTTLDISSLPQDIYFVRLTSDKSVATGKFIKQ